MFTRQSWISEPWRGRLLYGLMSVVVAFHTLALIVGPAPRESTLAQTLRPMLDPYLDVLYLNVGWGFFAPVGMTTEFHYEVVDSTGKTHTFYPTRGLRWYAPSNLWIKDRYRTVASFSDQYGAALIAEYCRKHANLKPVEIILKETTQEKEFHPEDHVAGKRSLGPEYATVSVLQRKSCGAS